MSGISFGGSGDVKIGHRIVLEDITWVVSDIDEQRQMVILNAKGLGQMLVPIQTVREVLMEDEVENTALHRAVEEYERRFGHPPSENELRIIAELFQEAEKIVDSFLDQNGLVRSDSGATHVISLRESPEMWTVPTCKNDKVQLVYRQRSGGVSWQDFDTVEECKECADFIIDCDEGVPMMIRASDGRLVCRWNENQGVWVGAAVDIVDCGD